jgi:hypothetical protein
MRIAEKREKFARDVTCFWNPDSDFRTGSPAAPADVKRPAAVRQRAYAMRWRCKRIEAKLRAEALKNYFGAEEWPRAKT